MSVNYATGLSDYPNKGVCGLPEKFDSDEDIQRKSILLAKWIHEAKGKVVVHTGAGISTACGIPDFRGPRGVWTLEKKNERPSFNLSFEDARPSLTHMALVAMEDAGYINAVITQNVDGLHLRSGFPRNRIGILHGDMFTEECELCRTLYQRISPVSTVGLKRSGSRCKMTRKTGRGRCRGYLRDTILDWEDQLPYEDLDFAHEQSQNARLSLCLGTSLRIVPGGQLPLLTKKTKKKKSAQNSDDTNTQDDEPGRVAIVNLQATKLDKEADLKIHGYVDNVMKQICTILDIEIPIYAGPQLVLQSSHTSQKEISRWTVFPSEDMESFVSNRKRLKPDFNEAHITEPKYLKCVPKSDCERKVVEKDSCVGIVEDSEAIPCKFEINPETTPLYSEKQDVDNSPIHPSDIKNLTDEICSTLEFKTESCNYPVFTSNKDVSRLHSSDSSNTDLISSHPLTINDKTTAVNDDAVHLDSSANLLSYVDVRADNSLKSFIFN